MLLICLVSLSLIYLISTCGVVLCGDCLGYVGFDFLCASPSPSCSDYLCGVVGYLGLLVVGV